MAKTYSRFGAALHQKCARCRQGDMFRDRNPYHLRHLAAMYKRCPHCGLVFEPEAGFYYGAMFISYALGVVACLLLYAILYFVFGISVLWGFISIVVCLLAVSPYLFRFSRALWLSFFVNYHHDI